ncbi:MAG TPA: hypothetical protein VGU71_11905 [Candidatus Dormibacteraeota bacterium]|nr:hypothetical protein [Candidatus Dormibacteraeota bacterium]
MAESRLAIDLSGATVRVLEGAAGGPMRCGETALPQGALQGGRVLDSEAVGRALRQVLARTEITATRAMIAVSDAIASFRVLTFPTTTSDLEVDNAIKRALPTASPRMALSQTEVRNGLPERTVYAAVWDRSHVQAIADIARQAGLEPAAIELKSLCLARALRLPGCVMVDLSGDPVEATLIDDHLPRVWHGFQLEPVPKNDLAASIAVGLRPVLRFYERRPAAGGSFGADSPILLRSQQVLPDQIMKRLTRLTGHPVQPIPQPARVPAEVRHETYLTCIGLIMRRQ